VSPASRTPAAPWASSSPSSVVVPPGAAAPLEPAPAERLLVVAGGDINLGREVGQAILADPQHAPFQALAPLWADADVRFANLESPLSDQGGETQSPRFRKVFTGPPGGARALAAAGVGVVSTANNHAWDYGRSAFFETLAHLDAASVLHAGTGKDLEAAYRPARMVVKGWKVAIFAVTQIWNYGPIEKHAGRNHVAWARQSTLEPLIRRARTENDLVLVSYHGGGEYLDAPVGGTRQLARAWIRAGADAVIGHHPHVAQGVEWFDGRPVFYSLGNLVFEPRPEHPWTRFGALARLELARSGKHRFSVCPIGFRGMEPRALEGAPLAADRATFHAYFAAASRRVGATRFGDPDALGCTTIEPGATTPALRDPRRADPGSRASALR